MNILLATSLTILTTSLPPASKCLPLSDNSRPSGTTVPTSSRDWYQGFTVPNALPSSPLAESKLNERSSLGKLEVTHPYAPDGSWTFVGAFEWLGLEEELILEEPPMIQLPLEYLTVEFSEVRAAKFEPLEFEHDDD
jgi:hypothetical protein